MPPDRKYWRPCFRLSRAPRCKKCTAALAEHPDGKIRRALVREGGLDVDTLRELSFDRDAIVAMRAKRQLDELETESEEKELLPEESSGKTLNVAMHAKRQLDALETNSEELELDSEN